MYFLVKKKIYIYIVIVGLIPLKGEDTVWQPITANSFEAIVTAVQLLHNPFSPVVCVKAAEGN